MSPWLLGEARGCPASRLQLGGGNGWEKLRPRGRPWELGFVPAGALQEQEVEIQTGIEANGPFPATYIHTEGWQASLFPLQSACAALPGCEAAFLGWKWCFHAGFCLQIIPLRVVPRVHSLTGVNLGRRSRQERE